jgi:hypothetical protein
MSKVPRETNARHKKILANTLISRFQDRKTTHIQSIIHNSVAMFSLKNLTSLPDSNPGLLLLRRTQCPLCHASTAKRKMFFENMI